MRVEFDGDYLKVRGSLGAPSAVVLANDVQAVSVQAGALGRGSGGMRQTHLQLLGHGTVLGEAVVNTLARKAHVVEAAAQFIREELRRRALAGQGGRPVLGVDGLGAR